jgi:hypothetical protein
MLNQYFFIIGGSSESGDICKDIIQLNVKNKQTKVINVFNNSSLGLLPVLSGSKCCGAFYSSRYL